MDRNGYRLLHADGTPAELGQLVSTDDGQAGVLCFALPPLQADDRAVFKGDSILVNTGDFTIQVPPATFGLAWTKVKE